MPRRRAPAPTPQNKYDAAGAGRRIKSWNPPSTGPNRAVEGLQRIRDRTRDSIRNDWAGASTTRKWATALVGVGITPRWKNERFSAIWAQHCPQTDADGVLDFYGQQTLATRTWMSAGEVFMRRRPRRLDAGGLALPVQYQLIEPDFVPLFDAATWVGMPDGHNIRQGIERDRSGQRAAYWLYREHPGDRSTNLQPDSKDLIRVAASDIAHIFEPDRPGALRGVSILAPVLVRLRASADFEDAVLDRQKLANLFVAFIKREMPPNWADVDVDPLTGLPKWYDAEGNSILGLEPGTTQELRPGESMDFANPPEAGTSFPDYMRTTHMGTAAGADLPYEFMSGDLRDVSDRTLRVVVNEFRRLAEQRQWQIVIPQMCRRAIRWAADAAALIGEIRVSEIETFASPEWAPHGWPDLHPTQDIEGRIKERDAGFTSTSAIISRKGDDPRKVLAERQADEKSGLTPLEPVAPAPVAPVAPTPPVEPPAAQQRVWDLQTQVAGLQMARAVEPAPAPAPQVDIVALVAAMNERAQQDRAADEEQRRADREQARALLAEQAAAHQAMLQQTVAQMSAVMQAAVGRPLTIESPTVNVTNDVQPATVSVDVNLPNRQIETDLIERNEDGSLKRVVQTERTLN